MKNLFYSNQITDSQIVLDAEETAHACRVLRMKTGDEIWITNGKGYLFHCKLSGEYKKQLTANIIQQEFIERSRFHIHLAIAPTKNMDRMEWLVEKITEIGVNEITPIICQTSERRIIKTERLQKNALSALKQSKQCWLPDIHEPIDFTSFLKSNSESNKYIAHCHSSDLPHLSTLHTNKITDSVICIGPEGDFTENEVSLAVKHGCKEISLGKTRLRTETAGLLAVISLSLLSQ